MSVHKDTCPSHNTIFRCIREIQTGCFELQKGKSPGRPISTSNAANVQKVKGLIDENCRLSCYELESITELPKTTVHDILVSNLGLRNVCSVWVQHKLSESNKTARVLACTELRKLFMIKGIDYMASHYLVLVSLGSTRKKDCVYRKRP